MFVGVKAIPPTVNVVPLAVHSVSASRPLQSVRIGGTVQRPDYATAQSHDDIITGTHIDIATHQPPVFRVRMSASPPLMIEPASAALILKIDGAAAG